nr:branched-chain amino acid transport system permease protein LivM [uncultured bacterium]
MKAGALLSRVLTVLGLLLLLIPFALGEFGLYVATELLIWGLFALSLDLLLGYAGLASFGHAVFFGVPAYVFGIILTRADSFPLAVMGAFAAVFAVALLIGYFATRTGGTGYIVVTLLASFALFTFALTATGITGGEDGLLIPRNRSFSAMPPKVAYLIVASVAVILFMLTRRLVRSNYGLLLLATKANERRVQALGYNVDRLKIQVTVVAAMVAATAGILYALLARTISAELVGPTLSTEVVIWVLLGGMQTLLGPVLGAALFMSIKQVLSTTTWYPLLLGLVFVAMVLWAPKGILGLAGYRRRQADTNEPHHRRLKNEDFRE